MKKLENKKKNWVKPEVVSLKIKKDTFGTSSTVNNEAHPNKPGSKP